MVSILFSQLQARIQLKVQSHYSSVQSPIHFNFRFLFGFDLHGSEFTLVPRLTSQMCSASSASRNADELYLEMVTVLALWYHLVLCNITLKDCCIALIDGLFMTQVRIVTCPFLRPSAGAISLNVTVPLVCKDTGSRKSVHCTWEIVIGYLSEWSKV